MKLIIEDVYPVVTYADLLTYAPDNYPQVSVYDKLAKQYTLQTVRRKYISYGKTPIFEDTGKSYMFNNKSEEMPTIIKHLLYWAQERDCSINNVYVNWYLSGDDFIAPHSDCTKSLVSGSNIMILNLNESSYVRTFYIASKTDDRIITSIPLTNNRLITLDAERQTSYRHWVGQENTEEGRISVTFRSVK